MLQLVNNNGYKWTSKDGVHFKGYFILNSDETLHVYRNEEACELIGNKSDFKDFVEFLKTIEGCWSVIVEKHDCTWMAVDIARSMPLYYSRDGQYISDSAEVIRQSLNIAKEDVNKDALVELAANYYLFGHKTVYSQIRQLELGEAVLINGNEIKELKYFYHINSIESKPVEEIKKQLTETIYRDFEKIKAVVGKRPVVLSMSGGYDSRLIGCMLKNVGIEDVSCYTYGKSDSFEVIQSKKNAEALGFRWKCVEMTDEWMSKQTDDTACRYLDSYNGHDFTAYMQNFPAVRKLEEEGWFKPNSVFLTGLCGDMPSGEYVYERYEQIKHNVDTAAQRLFDDAFTRFNTSSQLKEKWEIDMREQIKSLPIKVSDFQSWQTAVDCFYTGMCHAHWYMHMNRPHDFYGYEWLIPLWDSEYLKLWYSIPIKYRIEQNLYEDWLLNTICAPYGIGQKKTIGGYSRSEWKRKLQYTIGGIINFLLLNIGVPFKRKQDFNNFAPFELQLFKNIKSKKLVNYRRSGMMQLLDHFLIERRYGVENWKYFTEQTKAK